MTTNHNNFAQDLEFLNQHIETIVLTNSHQQLVAVVPAWQGRVMTSTANGPSGFSYGWVNYERIKNGKIEPQINLFGGEDRFWVSPEGSQYSFFFDPGQPMELKNWRTPRPIDTEPFELVSHQSDQADFRKNFRLTNYADTNLDLLVDRRVRICGELETGEHLGMIIPNGIQAVCYESQNRVTNSGDTDWTADRGLPAVWILCMNKPSDSATVLVPFQNGTLEERGKIVTADYFGRLDARRLRICEESNLIYFLGDGQHRSKLGVSFERAVNCLGAWDPTNGGLTIVQFNLPESVENGYTNNLWKRVDDPYRGDVINSYNDGPNENGGMMGPFYELETLSPALNLKCGESYMHLHRTIHLEGDRNGLSQIAQKVFGVDIPSIEEVF